MKQSGEFVKTTLKSGMLVLFPLFASLYVIVLIFGYLTDFIRPLVERFVPEFQRFGVTLINTISILLLLALCFGIGLVTRTHVGKIFTGRLHQFLSLIPGYRVCLQIGRIVFDSDDASGTPVVVQREDSRQLGFMMEQIGDEEVAVFLPEAPSLRSGAVEIVKASTVERLNVPPVDVARVIASYGAGTHTLFADADSKSTGLDSSRKTLKSSD